MPAVVVTINPDGWLPDVDLGDPDLWLEHLRNLVGCAVVRPITLSIDIPAVAHLSCGLDIWSRQAERSKHLRHKTFRPHH